jgi:hypothetical protein
MLGWIYQGQIVKYSIPNISHAALGEGAGLVVGGVAVEGAEAFTVIKWGGDIIVQGSINFGGIYGISNAAIEIVRSFFR